jgi:hypothetical protein
MNRTSRVNAFGAKLGGLLGSASVFTIANAVEAQQAPQARNAQVGQAETAQAEEIPENTLITGSLIRSDESHKYLTLWYNTAMLFRSGCER